MAKLLFKPFEVILAIAGVALSRRIFRGIWDRVDPDHEAPGARTENVSARRAIAARGLEAATAAMTVAALERGGARAFRHVTGFWPGDADPPPREP